MTEPWMENHITTDVQTAIQTQSIQTAQERNTQTLSGQAFASYIAGAPIPRAYFRPTTTTALTTSVEATMAWVAADIVFDPFGMFAGSNQFRIPADGFYSIDTAVGYQQPAGAGSFLQYGAIRSGVSSTYALNSILKTNQTISTNIGTSPFIVIPVTMVKPFKAGDLFYVVVYQASSANEVLTNTDDSMGLSIVWVAPYQSNQTAGVQ